MITSSSRSLRSSATRTAAVIVAIAALLSTAVSGPADAVDPGVDVVYVADGTSFADALVGAVLATSHNAPILTVAGTNSGDVIPNSTALKLGELDPKKIVILGGLAAISQKVEDELATYTEPPGNVDRIAGGDRFATAAAIADALPSEVARATVAADAEKLGGVAAADYAKREWVTVDTDGTVLSRSSGNAGQDTKQAPGTYLVGMSDVNLFGCALSATITQHRPDQAFPAPGVIAARKHADFINTVEIRTYGIDGLAADRPFTLVAHC